MPSKVYSLITGASEGIGREFAKALAAEHRNLILVARNRERLSALRDELASKHPIEAICVDEDLSSPGAVQRIASIVSGRTVACLINNAGFQVPMGAFETCDPEAVESMIAVNIAAATALARHFLPSLIEQRGELVNVASHAAFQPVPYMAAYAATKAYVLHWTEALSAELDDLHGRDVYVMALCPGATKTRFWERSSSPVEKTRFPVMEPAEVVRIAVSELKKRGRTVLIPSLLLRLATQSLRVSPRRLNLYIGRKLTGH